MQNQEFDNNNYSAPLINQSNELPAEPPVSPDNPPWNSWTAFGVWVASVLFLAVLGAVFLLPYLFKQSLDFSNQEAIGEFAKTDPTAVLLQVVATIPAHLLTLLLGWLVVTRFRKYDFRRTLGWQSGGFQWWYYPLILTFIFAVSVAVQYFFPAQETELDRVVKTSQSAALVVAFLATFTAPIVEEMVYRGILYSAFQRSFGVSPAVAVVTFIFAAVHFIQYWKSPSTIFLICFLSLVLTLVRVYSKNLLPCIILHTLINGLQSISLVAQALSTQNPDAATPHAQNASVIQIFNSFFY